MEAIIEKKKIKIQVGIATIVQDKDGVVIEAMFDPIIKVKDCTDLVSALKQINEPNALAIQAQTVTATWFSKLNDIELADREKFHMVMRVMPVLDMPVAYPQNTYPDGSKGHRFLFSFEER
jgi:hypothetical protein